MKEVKAFVRPKRITDIYHILRVARHIGVTVTEAEGWGDMLIPAKNSLLLSTPLPIVRLPKLRSYVNRLRWMRL